MFSIYRRTLRRSYSAKVKMFTDPARGLYQPQETSQTQLNLKIESEKQVAADTNNFNGINSVHSAKSSLSKSTFPTQVVDKRKRHQNLLVYSDNSVSKIQSNNVRNAIKAKLKRSADDPMLPEITEKRSANEFVFRNESDDDNMPVIVNVFTLSEALIFSGKPDRTEAIQRNNLPVTPPCSPPLAQLGHFIGYQNMIFDSDKTVQISSTRGRISKSLSVNRSSVIYRQTDTNRSRSSSADQTTHGNLGKSKKYLPFLQADLKNKAPLFTWKATPTNYGIPKSKLLSSESCSVYKNQQNLFEAANAASKRISNYEKLNSGHCDRLNNDQSGLSTRKTSDPIHCSVENSGVFLSPRQAKVLELKKKLQDQKAALQNLLRR